MMQLLILAYTNNYFKWHYVTTNEIQTNMGNKQKEQLP